MASAKPYESFKKRSLKRKVIALVRKDLLFEKASRRTLIIYTILSPLGLLLSSFDGPAGSPATGGLMNISTASQMFCMFSLMTTVMVPLLAFMFQIQNEKTYGSFAIYRTLPVGCHTLFWSKALSCSILTAICLLQLYLFYLIYLAFGLLSRDALTPVLLGVSYICFISSLSIFSSVSLIALAFNISPQLLPAVVTALSVFIVVFPVIFSRGAAGFDGQEAIVGFFARYGFLGGIALVLLLLSICVGGIGSWAFRLKRSYV